MGVDIRPMVSKGSPARVYRFSMANHCGTHIDMPNHFFGGARKASEYPAGWWFFGSPSVVELRLKPKEVLMCGEWCGRIGKRSDIVLFLSGWSKFRNRGKYIYQNPGIHPEVAVYLRRNFPDVRAIGIDWMSVSSYTNRPLGRKAHKAFLDPDGANGPVSIIEDMNLPRGLSGLKEVFVMPLLIGALDSAPCTVIGEFND